METKVCSKCQMELPKSAQHFDRKRSSPDGFHGECKVCRKEKGEAKAGSSDENRPIDAFIAKSDSTALAQLEQLIQRETPTTSLPHAAEVFEEVMGLWNGAAGFAATLRAEFLAARPGSEGRRKILQKIQELMLYVSQSGHAKVPLHLQNDEDLRRTTTMLLAQMNAQRLTEMFPDLNLTLQNAVNLPKVIDATAAPSQ
jgi:hypothetical protein